MGTEMQRVSVRLMVGHQGAWVPLAALVGSEEDWARGQLESAERERDELDGRAGFFLSVDSEPWNGPDGVDGFEEAKNWLDAFEEVILLERRWWVHVFMQDFAYQMRRERQTLLIELYQRWQSDIELPRIRVDLGSFARELDRELRGWLRFAAGVRAVVEGLEHSEYRVESMVLLLEAVAVPAGRQRLDRLELAVERLLEAERD